MVDLRQFLSSGWGFLKSHVDAIRATDQNPDEIQIELYELAFAYARLFACESLLDYREKALHELDETQFKPVDGIVQLFLAESLHDLQKSLDFVSPSLPANIDESTFQFLRTSRAPQFQSQIGDFIRKRGGQPLPDLLDEEKTVMRRTLRQLADEKIVPVAESIHRQNLTIPDELIEEIRQIGSFGISVPTAYGGSKLEDQEDSVGMVVVTEELSRGSLGAAGSLITRPEIMVRALLEGGTEDQKTRWLPGIAEGDPLCAISVTEPDTGSDVASVSLRATPTNGGWRLNGSKTWCTLAGKARLVLVLARTDAKVRPLHRGLSLFVVEKTATDELAFSYQSPRGGILSGRAISTLGYRGMHSFEMSFDDFFVPGSCLVGEQHGVNRGFYYTMRGFAGGRLQTAARATGLMQAAYEAASQYAEDREVFGSPIASYPLTLAKLARMAAYITAIQQGSYRVARLMDRHRGQIEASLIKLLACRFAEWVTRESVQIHGGMGYAEESPVSRYFVDARVLSIFEGTEETLALKVIGKALLEGALEGK